MIIIYRRSQYKPPYNKICNPTNTIPEIYNREGGKMDVYFLRDIHSAHDPYGIHSKYFLYDRYNYGLDTHFYTHREMLHTIGKPVKKYGMLVESPQIVPKDYKIFAQNKGLEEEFDAIFTYDAHILESISNACFYPGCAGVWYGRNCENIINERQFEKKQKNISIVSSQKTMCEMHKIRLELARQCKRNGWADTFGTFDGGNYVSIEESLANYRYSFAIENDISDYFFTERITSCFAAQTIPIYMGARKIEQFFNMDGIIRLDKNSLNDLEKIIKMCTKEEYENRLSAILDNYNRVQEYRNMLDYLYEHFLIPQEGKVNQG